MCTEHWVVNILLGLPLKGSFWVFSDGGDCRSEILQMGTKFAVNTASSKSKYSTCVSKLLSWP